MRAHTAEGAERAGRRGRISRREAEVLAGMGLFVAALYGAGFGLLWFGGSGRPAHQAIGLGTGVLALTLGMRHAFDADHIAFIDNATRKLVGRGERPLGVGLAFSLGHSSVVFALALGLGLGVRTLTGELRAPGSSLHHLGGVVGTSLSGALLYVIAGFNLVVLVSILRLCLGVRGGGFDEAALEAELARRGLLSRLFASLVRRVDAAWKAYPIGVLFGLGFDTATEIGLLVLAGGAVAEGRSLAGVLALPLLFAAGMSTFDTLDGCFMNFAYGWAFSRPARKVFYNLTVTGLSVMVAFCVGTVELLALLGGELHLHGWLWRATARVDLNTAGYAIVGVFALTWLVALGVWHLGRFEQRFTSALAGGRAEMTDAVLARDDGADGGGGGEGTDDSDPVHADAWRHLEGRLLLEGGPAGRSR